MSVELITKHQTEFERYFELYMAYNAHTNISAIRDREGVYAKHFADSLEAVPYITAQCYCEAGSVIASEAKQSTAGDGLLRHACGIPRNDVTQILDIGTGGGFPAVPLAIVLRSEPVKITALDSVGKKTKFVEQVKQELKLDNLEVIKSRAEDLAGRYDIVVSRALAMLSESLPYVAKLLKSGGIYIAYKKQDIDEEINSATKLAAKLKLELVERHSYDSKQLLIYKKH